MMKASFLRIIQRFAYRKISFCGFGFSSAFSWENVQCAEQKPVPRRQRFGSGAGSFLPLGTGGLLVALLAIAGCKDPYDVKVPDAQTSVLVVEGFLNSGGTTTIKLSRSFSLRDSARLRMERGASVSIESNNAQYQLSEFPEGNYGASLGLLDPSQQYRLHIRTGGKEYLSDYVKPQTTPPIDSVGWTRDQKGVTIYASTHDPANNSHYYRYEYEETWEKHAAYIARWEYIPAARVVAEIPPYKYQCWKTQPSTILNLATSTALQNDIVFEKPLLFISKADQRLSVRYSVLVKQFVLSKEAYEFFQLMKKNTESLGTVFDPQPSQIFGNIHAVGGSNEPAVGFFYSSSEQQKRLFITASEVPGWGFMHACDFQQIAPTIEAVEQSATLGLFPYDADFQGIRLVDYRVSETACFDCRVGGATSTKPIFW